MTEKTSSMSPRWLYPADAHAYLAMSKNLFEKLVRPYVAEIPLGNQRLAYDKHDLDRFADYHKRRYGRPPKNKESMIWEDDQQGQASPFEAVSGTSINRSRSGRKTEKSLNEFEKQLALAKEKGKKLKSI